MEFVSTESITRKYNLIVDMSIYLLNKNLYSSVTLLKFILCSFPLSKLLYIFRPKCLLTVKDVWFLFPDNTGIG